MADAAVKEVPQELHASSTVHTDQLQHRYSFYISHAKGSLLVNGTQLSVIVDDRRRNPACTRCISVVENRILVEEMIDAGGGTSEEHVIKVRVCESGSGQEGSALKVVDEGFIDFADYVGSGSMSGNLWLDGGTVLSIRVVVDHGGGRGGVGSGWKRNEVNLASVVEIGGRREGLQEGGVALAEWRPVADVAEAGERVEVQDGAFLFQDGSAFGQEMECIRLDGQPDQLTVWRLKTPIELIVFTWEISDNESDGSEMMDLGDGVVVPRRPAMVIEGLNNATPLPSVPARRGKLSPLQLTMVKPVGESVIHVIPLEKSSSHGGGHTVEREINEMCLLMEPEISDSEEPSDEDDYSDADEPNGEGKLTDLTASRSADSIASNDGNDENNDGGGHGFQSAKHRSGTSNPEIEGEEMCSLPSRDEYSTDGEEDENNQLMLSTRPLNSSTSHTLSFSHERTAVSNSDPNVSNVQCIDTCFPHSSPPLPLDELALSSCSKVSTEAVGDHASQLTRLISRAKEVENQNNLLKADLQNLIQSNVSLKNELLESHELIQRLTRDHNKAFEEVSQAKEEAEERVHVLQEECRMLRKKCAKIEELTRRDRTEEVAAMQEESMRLLGVIERLRVELDPESGSTDVINELKRVKMELVRVRREKEELAVQMQRIKTRGRCERKDKQKEIENGKSRKKEESAKKPAKGIGLLGLVLSPRRKQSDVNRGVEGTHDDQRIERSLNTGNINMEAPGKCSLPKALSPPQKSDH